jgi:hypothetical protein
MASQAASIRARLVRLTKTWPVDPLRPNLSFAGAIDKNVVQRVNFDTLSPEGIKYAQRAVESLEGIRVGRESVEVSERNRRRDGEGEGEQAGWYLLSPQCPR